MANVTRDDYDYIGRVVLRKKTKTAGTVVGVGIARGSDIPAELTLAEAKQLAFRLNKHLDQVEMEQKAQAERLRQEVAELRRRADELEARIA